MTAAPEQAEVAVVDLGLCNSGYCDREAVAYVVRRRGRVLVILGKRAKELSSEWPDALRCLDCAHHELDIALGAERKQADG